jgi:predicted HTH domain antitoxin
MNKFNTEVNVPVTITTRVDDKLAELIDSIAREEGMDRSTVLRRFLINSASDWLISHSLEEYESGKMSLWKAASRCGISLWEMIEEARKRGVYTSYSMKDLEKDMEGIVE